MRFTHFFFLLYFFVFFNCNEQKKYIVKVEGKQLQITDSITSNTDIESIIKPFRNHIEKDLDSVLSYSVDTYTKSNGNFNTAIGNFMADAVFNEANPIFNKKTGKNIDMVLLNHGGIRAILPKGNITKRTAYQIMPFENNVIVCALKGTQVNLLINYLCAKKKAHPISKLKLGIDKNFKIIDANIDGKKIEAHKTYYVATSDYLYNGGDNMTFFKPNDSIYILNYKIRNVLIDTFKKTDTIQPIIDDRFIQIK